MSARLSEVTKPGSKDELFTAFQADHALLGRGLHELRGYVVVGDVANSRRLAAKLIKSAGAHIAFEEHDFYPALRAWLSDEEVGRMYREHADGRRLLEQLATASDVEIHDNSNFDDWLSGIEELEGHVAGCGDLFGALGGLSETESERLLERLEQWRRKAPTWAEASAATLEP